jgi:putative transcriptional regulator
MLLLVAKLLAPVDGAAQLPGPGMFLVATDEVRGPFFRETVVLLLSYDDTGAQGLVINRPMPAAPMDVLPDLEGIDDYEGTLYWGGPVQITSVRSLLRSDNPPPDAARIVDGVYLVAPDADMPAGANDASRLRYFLGYAGWGAGQLDGELLDDSWLIVPATAERVFDADTDGMWRRMLPPREIRAANPGQGKTIALIL